MTGTTTYERNASRTTGDASLEQITREARVAGLPHGATPTLEAVERRRLQLWGLAVVLLLAVSSAVALVSTWRPAPAEAFITPTVLRVAVVLLTIAFGVYAIEKELHLRRLGHLLTNQAVVATSLARRLEEMSLLLEAGKAVNSVLDLPAVLETILRSALKLLSGDNGSIMLLDRPDELVAVIAHGDDDAVGRRVRIGSGVSGTVAATREGLLISAEDMAGFPGIVEPELQGRSALSVPLVNRNVLFGVLNVRAEANRCYAECDLQSLSLFAEQAAGALANSRLYEMGKKHLEQADLVREFGALHEVNLTYA